MNARPYLIVSAILFLLVALMHLLRFVLGWSVQIGTSDIPLWMSLVAVIVSVAFAIWGWSLTRRH